VLVRKRTEPDNRRRPPSGSVPLARIPTRYRRCDGQQQIEARSPAPFLALRCRFRGRKGSPQPCAGWLPDSRPAVRRCRGTGRCSQRRLVHCQIHGGADDERNRFGCRLLSAGLRFGSQRDENKRCVRLSVGASYGVSTASGPSGAQDALLAVFLLDLARPYAVTDALKPSHI